jgi:hypothetical protein
VRIAYDNLIDSATAPTALTEDILYPIENVQNQRLAKKYRTTDLTAQTVVVDLASAQDVDTIAVLEHNMTASSSTTIEAHTADSWTSPSFTTTLTYNSGPILKYLSSAESYRYWRFTFDDQTNTDGYIAMGRLWLGTYLTIDPSSLLNFSVTKKRSDTVTYGRDRQKYATEGVGWRSFRLSFPRSSQAMVESLLTMIDTVGAHGSVIFSNFDTDRSYTIVEPCYCSVVGEVTFRHTRRMRFEYSLELEEDR